MMIPKAATKMANRTMSDYIPHSIVSSGTKIVAEQQKKESQQGTGRKKKVTKLTEINHNGKTVLKGKTTVAAAIKKLHDYEETGLLPYEIHNLMERTCNLEKRIKKLESWEDDEN